MPNNEKGTTIYTDEKYYKHTSDKENKNSYQYFGKKLGLSNLELFLITVLIGKYIVKNREDINNLANLFKYESALKMGDPIKILQILAIEETEDMNILNDKPRMFDIWEGYAMAGMKEFCNWYHSNTIDFEAKLEEEMSNVFNSLTY